MFGHARDTGFDKFMYAIDLLHGPSHRRDVAR